jgi:hypothetical protein
VAEIPQEYAAGQKSSNHLHSRPGRARLRKLDTTVSHAAMSSVPSCDVCSRAALYEAVIWLHAISSLLCQFPPRRNFAFHLRTESQLYSLPTKTKSVLFIFAHSFLDARDHIMEH